MKMESKFCVIIATSMNRVESLFGVALASVRKQTRQPDAVVVVDDNNSDETFAKIKTGIDNIYGENITYLKNCKTKNMSGTGCWNTGIEYFKNKFSEEAYVAILDDDDYWDETYIEEIFNVIETNSQPLATFAFLKRSDCKDVSAFNKGDLKVENFLVGNPGIQGSNMCFKIKALTAIDGFDENLSSCTDRDLMIRFLERFGNEKIAIVGKKLVNHIAGPNTVTSNLERKASALDFFYDKHLEKFGLQTLQNSLQRAEKFFKYPHRSQIEEKWFASNHILITGVCGFIGSNLAKKLVTRGYKVVGIDNLSTGVIDNISEIKDNPNFCFCKGDIADKEFMSNVFKQNKISTVCHLAALPRIKFSIDYPERSQQANVDNVLKIAEISKEYGVKRFLFSSSSSVYGDNGGKQMSETDELNPISPYAKQKLEAERILLKYFKGTNVSLLIFRLFNVYGFSCQPINEYSTLIAKAIAQIDNNNNLTITGNGLQRRDFTYIDDVTNAFEKAVRLPFCSEQNILNIGYGQSVSVNEVIDFVSKELNKEATTTHLPSRDYEPLSTLSNTVNAQKILNWQADTPIDEGIRKTVNRYRQNQTIAIGVAMHNNASTIRRCIKSILNQKNLNRRLLIVLANDNSSDNWREEISDLLKDNRISLINLQNNNVVKTRNDINDYICNNYPSTVLIGRLDADDEYSGNEELSKIEKKFVNDSPDVILCGNYLRQNNSIISRTNIADKRLKNVEYVLERLKSMSEGIPEGELPSCNIFVKPSAMQKYPDCQSGEDHAFLTYYLVNQDKYKICFAEELLPVIYNLDGNTTSSNKNGSQYIDCRKKLYIETLKSIYKDERTQKARLVLADMHLHDLEYLGKGNEGIVFHDNVNVYKVLVSFYKGKDKFNTLRRLSFFRNLKECKHMYNLDEIIEFNGYIIEKYKYEISIPCDKVSEDDVIGFLVECWQNKLIVQDCKIKNFIKVDNVLKLVDLDACEYNDNMFLNMCVRMYLYAHYFDKIPYNDFIKLQRSAINNFELPELTGAREFVNKVFANIIFKESSEFINQYKIDHNPNSESYSIETLPNLENLLFSKIKENKYLSDIQIDNIKLNDKLYFEPQQIQVSYEIMQPLKEKVTLLIKTCAQDIATIEANIKHIVKQLSSPNPFCEIVVSIDTKKNNFLREFNSNADLQKHINIIENLVKQNVIDRYFLYDQTKTKEINKRWFGVECNESHSVKNIPVSSQLYAFEQCKGDYILQCDSDVLIGRKDYSHSYLSDMIEQLRNNDKVISVGFNIYNPQSKDYFGFEDGGFVPEVRLGLFDKKRFFSLRPFPNKISSDGKLMLSWYRSVEQFQKQTGYCSIRGGDNRTFYVHPQNYRKKEPYAWLTILDRIEQNQIPEIQLGKFDLEGSFYDWCIPKRNEQMVVVSVFRNVSIERFLRFWCSLMSQSYQDFGIVLYDDCSDNGLQYFVDKIIAPHKDRVTFIKGRNKSTKIEAAHRCIHYFCNNPNSIIVMIDGDDALIGKQVLKDIFIKYNIWNVDVLIGRVHQTYRLQPHYRYPVNFCNPRKYNGGNVWQHLKTFSKYLYDSIPQTYFKYECTDNVELSKTKYFEKCDDYAMMIPIVEMSKSPLQMDCVNYYYERNYENKDADRDLKEKCIAEILNKPKLNQEDVFVNRKKFSPDFDRIEIDITYDCNLKCIGCNRSCSQAPTKEQMQIEAIQRFVDESIALDIKWEQINVLGGEPTLHKDFMQILGLLQSYADKHSNETIIKVVSNGIAEKSRALCEEAKRNFKNVKIDYASYKTGNKVEYFSPFNDAPIDDERFINADYSKACWVANYCGIGLNSRGYFACSVCGGIDRVLNKNIGTQTIAELTEQKLNEHFETFCRLCGNYKAYSLNYGNFIPRCEKEPFKEIISKTWLRIYEEYNKL
ncbi:MAG: SDR family NAD(P)-dependent oxidoreductase [Opitutales bacterium]|nr:SDR family NAD(P)-dependent oxidoreductase [Opitutales bacterium]